MACPFRSTPKRQRWPMPRTREPMIPTVKDDPHCRCGAAIVGTVEDGVRHGFYRCVVIGSSDAFDPDPNMTRRTPWESW
jgi:hypothetical protein